MHLKCTPLHDNSDLKSMPSFILFDSLDGRIYDSERKRADLRYFEYCEIRMDGENTYNGARDILVEAEKGTLKSHPIPSDSGTDYEIQAIRILDHMQLRIITKEQTLRVIIALPDSTRFAYIGITGENCKISNLNVTRNDKPESSVYIPRIAEEITYIDVPSGDIPNIQVNGWCTEATMGIPITDGLEITFHTVSLPTARLIWHCPYIMLFSSRNGFVKGPGFREFNLIRIDGESWESNDELAENSIVVNIKDDFKGWDYWKEVNKTGYDCKVTFNVEGNHITVTTVNQGISIRSTTIIRDELKKVYTSLTGDQVALTNIRITH